MKNFISLYDNALSSEECKFIIDYFENVPPCEGMIEDRKKMGVLRETPAAVVHKSGDNFIRDALHGSFMCQKPGTINGSVNTKLKDSTDVGMSFNFDDNIVNQILMKSLSKHTRKYIEENEELRYISTWGIKDTYNLQRYYPKQGYTYLHCENYNMNSNKRVLVWMFYLNTVNDDGETYFSNYDLKVNPVEGRLVIWPAYWTHCHKGIVSNTETKYIATGWFEKIESATIVKKVKKDL